MKRVNLLFIGILPFYLAAAQGLKLNQDQCVHCSMLIRDQLFASMAISNDGTTLKFDAIECLINYLKAHKEEDFQKILVSDYSQSGGWIPASEASYLISRSIPSPMGAYLSAYSDQDAASKIQKQKGGELYSWNEVKRKFKDSNFGLLNHPDHHHDRADAYASIGVMGDHVHHKGRFMVSLRYMNMKMNGNQSGTAPVPDSEIYNKYMAAPQQMQMGMYMVGVMYAPTDRLTLVVMQSFIKREMQMESEMTMGGMSLTPMSYRMKSAGLGDLMLSGLYSLWASEKTSFHVNAGVSVPQGDITKSDDTPLSDNMKLPYTMQLGSGTIDCMVGGTFKQSFRKASLGLQPLAVLRAGENNQGYRLGNSYKVNGWFAYGVAKWLGLIARTEATLQQGISGVDTDLNPMMAPPANKSNYGYEQVKAYAGANVSFTGPEMLKNVKLGIEMGAPVYRKVTGTQMREGINIYTGIRYLL